MPRKMTTRGSFIERSAAVEEFSRQPSNKASKTYDNDHKAILAGASLSGIWILELLLGRRRVVFRRQLLSFTAAQFAQEILFRFKRPAGERPLMAVIADFVRAPMTSVAIDDSRVRHRYAAQRNGNPKRQRKLSNNAGKFGHEHFAFAFLQGSPIRSNTWCQVSGVRKKVRILKPEHRNLKPLSPFTDHCSLITDH